MSYKIVIDSCGELLEQWKQDERFASVPLTLTVGSENIIDDETFNQLDFLRRVKKSITGPKSSCPSPKRYMQAYEDGGADHIYVVTLSEQLSGSYNSARLGQQLFEEKHPDRKVHVFNSRSASIGQTLGAMKAEEYELAGCSFEEVVEKTEQFVDGLDTYFVLESLETLRKNGRLSGIKAFVASALNIKPVMGATPEGSICQLGQARGINKAIHKMVEAVVQNVKNPAEKILAISHCNCYERALMARKLLEEKTTFKDIMILDTNGISSLYANDGGVIIAV